MNSEQFTERFINRRELGIVSNNLLKTQARLVRREEEPSGLIAAIDRSRNKEISWIEILMETYDFELDGARISVYMRELHPERFLDEEGDFQVIYPESYAERLFSETEI